MVPPPDNEKSWPLEAKQRLGSLLGKFTGIADFFGEAAEAVEKSSAIDAVVKSMPWVVGAIGEAASEALPPVKFAVSLVQRLLEENDPKVLGLLACTLAYQGAVEEAMKKAGVPAKGKKVAAGLKGEILKLEGDGEVDFGKFSFATALRHPFIIQSDAIFECYLAGVGYNDDQRRLLLNVVHYRFAPLLKAILSHRDTKEKFEPFAQLMDLGTEEERAYDAVLSHVEYQRWQFEEERIFGNEPFALKHVYIDTECGHLTWGEIQDGVKNNKPGSDRFDPFGERFGGRHDLLETVTGLMKRKDFHEAIVIQGAAGSGKSSFTLRLCSVLEKEGLFPIRIRLRDLPLDRHVSDAIPIAMFPKDHDYAKCEHWQNPPDIFNVGVLTGKSAYGDTEIRPFVLILDGWDEISISAQEGYKQRVTKMLDEVKSQYLKRGGTMVRVILTGRPSAEVGESNFLTPRTPVLTVRPLQPEALRHFVDRTRMALEDRPCGEAEAGTEWAIPPDEELSAVFENYANDFKTQAQARENAASKTEGSGPLAVLGLPLLAYLAIRLIAQWDGDRVELISDTTTLYRNLADLTCGKRGQPAESDVELEGHHPTGYYLRRQLHKIATAMTAYGEESIGHDELSLRLEQDDLDERTQKLTHDNPLSTLMIAFFFKGGHKALGCEFLHKSFREYFFAEGIVEEMKEFAMNHPGKPRAAASYWQDYDPNDEQHAFSRMMAEILSPQWLSLEVVVHLERLLAWDIARSTDQEIEKGPDPKRCECPATTVRAWEDIRDRLADLWRWWADGILMRPQPVFKPKTADFNLEAAYAHELVYLDLPRDRGNKQRKLEPARTSTMDAHLGDGLFRIAAVVHYQIALRQGWLDPRTPGGGHPAPAELWANVEGPPPANNWEGESRHDSRPYQAVVRHGDKRWAFFAPAGFDPRYFANFVARINAAGWRPGGIFPFGVRMDGSYLAGSQIAYPGEILRSYRPASWIRANLATCVAALGYFSRNDFSETFAVAATFSLSLISECRFCSADLQGSWFEWTYAPQGSFARAQLDNASFNYATLFGSDFQDASMEGVSSTALAFEQANNLPTTFQAGGESWPRGFPTPNSDT